MITLTDHAVQRGEERLNLNRASLQRLAERAFAQGTQHSATRGRLNRYLSKLFFEHRTANNLRLYGHTVFIFCDTTLITLHAVPKELARYL